MRREKRGSMAKPLIGITCHAFADSWVLRSAAGQPYIDAVVGAGGAPVCIPLGLDEESLDSIYGTLDGLLLPGGDDLDPQWYGHLPHPLLGSVDLDRDRLEIGLARRALEDDLPLLGICRGIQVMAVAAGGTLYQDIPTEISGQLAHDVRQFGRDHLSHEIDIEQGSLLAQALGCTRMLVNSFHHQSVRDVPNGFVVTARADDGVVEAMEAPGRQFALAVQCHPEGAWRTTAPAFAALFEAFVLAASGRPAAETAA